MPVPTANSEPFGFEAWCQRELSRLLKFSVGEDLISYLVSMETVEEAEEYIIELLGKDTPPVARFLREFLQRWRPPERPPQDPTPEEAELLEALVRPKQEELVLFSQEGHQKKKDAISAPALPPGLAIHRTSKNPPNLAHNFASTSPPSTSSSKSQRQHNIAPQGLQSLPSVAPSSTTSDRKQKQKFVSLMSAEGQSKTSVHLPGRHPCQCLAQQHTLVNNCTECGRVVCSQEGSGPCLFCGALVCTPEEEELLARDSKKAQKFKEKLVKQFQIKDSKRAFDHILPAEATGKLSKAVQHKDKLLEFDQTSVRQTKVIDDESDYFSVDGNPWLSSQERVELRKKEEELREKKYGSRRNRTVTLDIAGRRVVEDHKQFEIYSEEHIADLQEGYKAGKRVQMEAPTAASLCNPSIPTEPPKFVETSSFQKLKRAEHHTDHDHSAKPLRPSVTRLQDRTLQDMADKGQCLSMHQPWASLLVTGVKRVEGRTWYTTHRGRLWIAAAAKQPTPEEIKTTEDLHRRLHGEKEVWLPTEYPVGCLLGCVDVVDCLSQEEYRQQFPNGESESPFVFVVESPFELPVKFPIKGEHKIWKLPKDIHTAAKRACLY